MNRKDFDILVRVVKRTPAGKERELLACQIADGIMAEGIAGFDKLRFLARCGIKL